MLRLTSSASFIAFSILASALSLTLFLKDSSSSLKASMYSGYSLLALTILVNNQSDNNFLLNFPLDTGFQDDVKNKFVAGY